MNREQALLARAQATLANSVVAVIPGEEERLPRLIARCERQVDELSARIRALSAMDRLTQDERLELERSEEQRRVWVRERNRLRSVMGKTIETIPPCLDERVVLGSVVHLEFDCADLPPSCVCQCVGLDDNLEKGRFRMSGPLGTTLLGHRSGEVLDFQGGKVTIAGIFSKSPEGARVAVSA